jgi:hypothetical protein
MSNNPTHLGCLPSAVRWSAALLVRSDIGFSQRRKRSDFDADVLPRRCGTGSDGPIHFPDQREANREKSAFEAQKQVLARKNIPPKVFVTRRRDPKRPAGASPQTIAPPSLFFPANREFRREIAQIRPLLGRFGESNASISPTNSDT